MHDLKHLTPYAEVNEALGELLAGVETALGPRFVGMYLSGSLALGDFDPQGSDIDYVVVTDGELPDDRLAALREMHERFEAGDSPWAGKVEAVYVPRDVLRSHEPRDAKYPQVEKERPFFLEPLEAGWIYHCYTLREHPLVLAGPDPRALIAPPDPDDMRGAAAPIAALWLEQARSDPSWLEWLGQRKNQAFVVLTLCRLLYTLNTGAVASKPGAARWAKETLGERRAGLIEGSLPRQHDESATPESEARATVAFVEYTVERFRQWESATSASR